MQKTDILEDPRIISMFREVGIASHLIGTGLTTLRKADFVNHWKFGSSFFSLTIGIERICKLVLIRKYQRINNGDFPSNLYIKKFSHSISDLIKEITKDTETQYIGKVEIVGDIINFFSKFANTIRYYNLDLITMKVDDKKDPMKIWSEIQNKIIKDHYKEKNYTLQEKNMIDAAAQFGSFYHRDMQGNLINNAHDFYKLGKTTEIVQSYSVFYIYKLLVDIVSIIRSEQTLFYTMPSMTEFFPYFHEGDLSKKQILTKKNWVYN